MCLGSDNCCTRVVIMQKRKFEFEEHVNVKVDGKSFAASLNVKHVNGDMFFNLKKSDFKLAKLLTCDIEPTLIENAKRPLTQTDIIEKCYVARDKAFYDQIKVDAPEQGGRLRYNKALRPKVMALPDTMVITLPATCGLEEFSCKAVTSKPSETLWIELSEDVLNYLVCAVEFQMRECTIKREHPRFARDEGERVDFNEKGASYCYTGKLVRVRYMEDGKKRSRYIQSNSCVEGTRDLVSAFAQARASNDNSP